MVLPFKEIEKAMNTIWTFPFHGQKIPLAGDIGKEMSSPLNATLEGISEELA